MRIIPNTTLKLYANIIASNENNERIAWSSPAKRDSYFDRHLVYSKTVQIVKKTGQLKISLKDINGATLEECNYLSWINPAYDNKKYFARILEKDYKNNECALITYRIDWWITDMFEMNMSNMPIEREHMSQSDAERAQANPFSGDILELRTQERGLDVSEDLQKLNYNITGSTEGITTDVDGLFVMQAISGNSETQDITNYIIMLAPIDFEALDGEASEWFYSLLGNLRSSHTCFYNSPNDDRFYSADSKIDNKKWGSKLPHPFYTLGFSDVHESVETEYSMKAFIDKLTTWGVVGNILAIYGVPFNHMDFFCYVGLTSIDADPKQLDIGITSKDYLNGMSPKLMNYPFSYVRVSSPSGDTKEYRYDKFASCRDGSNRVKFYMIGDLAEKPQIALVPDGYGMTFEDSVFNRYGNFAEALFFNQYATVAYVTDAWLAQIAALSVSSIDKRTTEFLYDMALKQISATAGGVSLGLSMADAGMDIASGDFIGGLVKGLGSYYGNAQYMPGLGENGESLAQSIVNNEANISDSALQALNGRQDGNALYENMKFTRPAHVAHQYHGGTGDGSILMNTAVNSDFCLVNVRLNQDILEQYNRYFKMYGYSSGRLGIPRIFEFILGKTDTTLLPDWQEYNDVETTYIKTNGAKVFCKDFEAEVQIARILDNGVRIINGDKL